MKAPTGAPGARIVAIGEHRPSRVVTNAEICEQINSTDEWIRERSGIITRRYAAPDETVADMATSAASKALAASGVAAEDVDLVIVASCTHPYQTPGASSEVQDRIGAINAGAMDIQAACAGFCYSLSVANDAIRSGSARHVVVVGSEKLTEFVDPHDRTMAFLFGDGAGAAVVGGLGHARHRPGGVGQRRFAGLDHHAAPDLLAGADRAGRRARHRPVALKMDGQTVFRWAVTKMAPVARRAMELAGVTPDELGAFVPHQANLRIVDALVKALKLPDLGGHRPRHGDPGQHLVGVDPARPVRAAGARRGGQRTTGAVHRLRRRFDVRRASRSRSPRSADNLTHPSPPTNEGAPPWRFPSRRSSPDSPRS